MKMEVKALVSHQANKQNIFIIIILAFVAIGTQGFKYVNWPWGSFLFSIFTIGLSFFCIKNKKFLRNGHFRGVIILFIILPFTSIINAYTLYNQSIFESIKTTIPFSFVWIMYYFLHVYEVKEKTILKALLYIGLFIVIVQVTQQITYPNVLFGIRQEQDMIEKGWNELAETRNGLWRFRIGNDMYYTAPLLFLLFQWLKQKYSLKYVFIFLLFITSAYLTLTRQVIISIILTLILSYILDNKKIKKRLIIFGSALFFVLYNYYDILFANLSEQTRADVSNDNIRIYAASFFLNDSLKYPLTFLFGYGRPAIGSHLFNYYQSFNQLGFYVDDVGFIGMIWQFGIFYVIISFYLLYLLLFKLKNKIPPYIRLFVLYVTIMSIMIFPFGADNTKAMIWPLLLYICDLHINNSPLVLRKYI